MELFEIINSKATPSVHALVIEPFKSIWEADSTTNKGEAVKIFTYVELLCSPKKSNPFFGYSEEERPGKVKKEVWGDPNFTSPYATIIMKAVIKYKELLASASPTYELYLSAVKAADTLKKNLNNLNLAERTTAGSAVFKPKDITSAIKDIPDTITSLESLRGKVHDEIVEASKTRKDREIGAFER